MNNKERNEIFLKNKNLIWAVVNRAKRKAAFDVRDLFQVGAETLLRAIERYNPENVSSFSNYAFIAIERGIDKYMARNESTVSAPWSLALNERKLYAVFIDTERELGRTPTINEIQEKVPIDKFAYNYLRAKRMNRISVPYDESYGDLTSHPEKMNPVNCIDDFIDAKRLAQRALRVLTPADRALIERVYGLNGRESETIRQVANSENRSESGLANKLMHLRRRMRKKLTSIKKTTEACKKNERTL